MTHCAQRSRPLTYVVAGPAGVTCVEARAKHCSSATTLVLTHRLSSHFDADQIAILADGRIPQGGASAGLARVDGRFRRMIDGPTSAR